MTDSGMMDPEVWAQRKRGEICAHHACREPHPRHAIVWICPGGHRLVIWYCAPHSRTQLASVLESGARIVCNHCSGLMWVLGA
jgi:hypothetical protein